MSLYFEPLDADSGAIRVLPGSHLPDCWVPRTISGPLDGPERIPERFGIEPDEVPSWTLDSEPGDVLIWDFRLVHAAFNSGPARRGLSLNYLTHTPPT